VVYDTNGRLVRTLVDENRDFGTHEVAWDGRNDAGITVGSGVYFYRLTAGKHTESKKMVLLK
jgi:flagellar hook assembly protein FlgD